MAGTMRACLLKQDLGYYSIDTKAIGSVAKPMILTGGQEVLVHASSSRYKPLPLIMSTTCNQGFKLQCRCRDRGGGWSLPGLVVMARANSLHSYLAKQLPSNC